MYQYLVCKLKKKSIQRKYKLWQLVARQLQSLCKYLAPILRIFHLKHFISLSKDFQIRLNLRCLACLLSRVELKNFITKASLK